MQGFELKQVVPVPMADVAFEPASVWKNDVVIRPEHTLIVAPSGSGKTSLLSFLYGMRHNYTGTIRFEGDDLSAMSLKKWSLLRQQKLSVIFQDLRLLPHLSVGENLQLKNNLTKFKTTEQIKHMLDRLGIAHKWDQSCGTLSYGQQQRVSIVRAMLQPFAFLLADEPFSHIDEANIEKAKTLILDECRAQQAALVMLSLDSSFGINFNNTLRL